ncbi:hypothetical protein [Pseudomonas sp. RC10]|uniref:hypothetical protein n=1 Tax=Pseudomonas bambusae TaxID=3139142 RepID=UPI003139B300
MLIRKGEIISIASGAFEGFETSGPFVAEQDFDFSDFVDEARATLPESASRLDVQDLMDAIPDQLLKRGLIAKVPCRNLHLGAFGDWDLQETLGDH